MKLAKLQPVIQENHSLSRTLNHELDEIITTCECKQFIPNPELSEERINTIKNNLIGIVNSAINVYLEDFK